MTGPPGDPFRVMAEGAPVMIWMSDSQGRCTAFNTPWLDFTGRTLEQELGHGWAEGVHPEDRPRCLDIHASSFEAREGFTREYRLRRRDGEYRWVLDNGVPRFQPDGTFDGFIGSCVDMTNRKRAEADREALLVQIDEARKKAEAAARSKDELLSTVSHDLRTPLNAIAGWIQVLRASPQDESILNRAIETIERSVRHQARLLEDMLDLSRIIDGDPPLNVRPVDLATVIAAALDSVRGTAQAKDIRLDVELDRSAGHVIGDRDRLQQMLFNLLSNAIETTGKGGRIEVRLERGDSRARIRVIDTGQGTDLRILPPDGTTPRARGGLGLAIARQLVELHGGALDAAGPGMGQGAVFTVDLPWSEHGSS